MFVAIVPAYNEEKRIGQVVRDLAVYVDEVVVVDDKSEDSTIIEAKNNGATVLRHKINLGQGAALETGHEYARRVGADYVIHFDGDGQFSAEDIKPALAKLQIDNVDIILGSRFLGNNKNKTIPWTKRYILSPVSRFIDRLFSGLKLTDAHNGFRILNKNALEKIKITQNGMAHASEIPNLIKKHNLKYSEIPITVYYHEYGQGLSGGFKIVRDLLIGRFIK